jgi:hypothetical protein
MVSYSDLHADNLFEIFKYLNIRERVKFERLSKRESMVIHKLFLSQKALVFCFYYFIPEVTCGKKDHRVLSTDVLDHRYHKLDKTWMISQLPEWQTFQVFFF